MTKTSWPTLNHVGTNLVLGWAYGAGMSLWTVVWFIHYGKCQNVLFFFTTGQHRPVLTNCSALVIPTIFLACHFSITKHICLFHLLSYYWGEYRIRLAHKTRWPVRSERLHPPHGFQRCELKDAKSYCKLFQISLLIFK